MTRYGIDERNLARLNPVLGLNRLPETLTGWRKTAQVDNLGIIELSCDSGKHLAPHGIDADVIFALTTAYEAQGRPENRMISLNIGQICDVLGLSRSSNTYQRIYQSLRRLNAATFTASQCWHDANSSTKEMISIDFRIINTIIRHNRVTDDSDVKLFQAQTTLAIELHASLVNSIRSKHTKFIDLALYGNLNQPLSRLLYRLLDEMKHITSKNHYQVDVHSWAEHLGFREIDEAAPVDKDGIPVTRVFKASRVLRALKPAHDELLREGYLKSVTISSGRNQRITYEFSSAYKLDSLPKKSVIKLEVIKILIEQKVSRAQAEKLSILYSVEELTAALKERDRILSSGFNPKNKTGFLISILKEPERYKTSEPNPIYKTLESRQPTLQLLDEPQQPPKSVPQAEAALMGALKNSESDRQLRDQIIQMFLNSEIGILALSELGRCGNQEARDKAEMHIRNKATE